jgi:hypothetical protein
MGMHLMKSRYLKIIYPDAMKKSWDDFVFFNSKMFYLIDKRRHCEKS